jgi:hypothetical protein
MIDMQPKSRGLQYEFLKGMDGRRLLGHERRLQMVDEPIHGGIIGDDGGNLHPPARSRPDRWVGLLDLLVISAQRLKKCYCDQIVTKPGIIPDNLAYFRIPQELPQLADKTDYYFVLWRLRETDLSRPESNALPSWAYGENPISRGKCIVFLHAPLVRRRIYAIFVT